MEVHFNEVIDPIKIPVEFKAVDRSVYDAMVEKDRQSNLASKACIKVSTGADLVNIYFQSCCDSYKKTVIELYLANGEYSKAPRVMGRGMTFHQKLLSATPSQISGMPMTRENRIFLFYGFFNILSVHNIAALLGNRVQVPLLHQINKL